MLHNKLQGLVGYVSLVGFVGLKNRLTDLTLLTGLTLLLAVSSHADVPKGQWGRAIPIADNNHPNLYYNQSEVDELRTMILVQRSPQALVDLYNTTFKSAVAQPTYSDDYSDTNVRAAISYMIEPTSTKADAIKAALLSYQSTFPNGLWDWYTSGGCHFCGYWVPWMFDLLLAYHPGKLSAGEIAGFKTWFKTSAERLKFNARDQCAIAPGSGPCNSATYVAPVSTHEGKRTAEFPNWYTRFMGPALGCALVSGDQATVDYWADSGWPHDLFTYDGVSVNGTYPSDNANRFDLAMYLLAVYPSGANTDTYTREGFNVGQRTWYTTSYTWGEYHFATMIGAMLGSEMAYHNGMSGAFGITDVPGTEPALLRTFKLAIQSRTEPDFDPANSTGHPIIGWDPIILLGTRRYSDPTLNNAVSGILSYNGPIPQGGFGSSDLLGFDVPGAVSRFFSYPKRVVWSPTSYTCPGGVLCDGSPVTGTPNQVACGTDLNTWQCTPSGWVGPGTPCACGTSPCDVNGSGATNVSDVQLCANQAIGVVACSTADINLDGQCNVIDVQRVVNAALGGSCVSP